MMFSRRRKAILASPQGASCIRGHFLRTILGTVFGGVMHIINGPVHAMDSRPSHLIQGEDHTQVNWTLGRIQAIGSASPSGEPLDMAKIRMTAELAARDHALDRVIRALMGIQITADVTGKDQLDRSEVRFRVEQLLEQCTAENTRYYADGAVDLTLECAFAGGLTTALLPNIVRKEADTGPDPMYTGLIVDATHARMRPVLVPTIRWRNGDRLVAPELISAEAIRLGGGVRYVTTMEAAHSHVAAGNRPLVVSYIRRAKNGAWLVTSDERDSSTKIHPSFLRKGKIVVVLPRENMKP